MAKKRKARATHLRNMYSQSAPDFAALAAKYPSFARYVTINRNGRGNIDWTDYNATRELTRVLLEHDFGVKWWIPDGQLCPTLTNRANYIRWLEDLLLEFPAPRKNDSMKSLGKDESNGKSGEVRGLDIGTGANVIYPLLGASLLGWKFVGTDVTDVALEWAKKNVEANPQLMELIEIRSARNDDDNGGKEESSGERLEDCSGREVEDVSGGKLKDFLNEKRSDASRMLVGVVEDGEEFDFSMCNPPFFESMEEAGLNPRTACGGTLEEMVCCGGEAGFVSRMIQESAKLGTRIHWYSSMVGKKASLKLLKDEIRACGATMLRTTEFVQGKTSRWGLAWSFSTAPTIKSRVTQTSSKNSTSSSSSGSFSFMLDGIDRQRSALDVLNALASHLKSHGAACQVDETKFTIAGAFEEDAAALDHRNPWERVEFTAAIYQQCPGCLLIKAAVSKGARDGGSFLSALESSEHALREQFTRNIRRKLQ